MSRSSLYSIEISHPGLNKFRVIRGASRYEVQLRGEALKAQWDDEWRRRLEVEGRKRERREHQNYLVDKKSQAAERTQVAEMMQAPLATLLVDGARCWNVFDWENLKERAPFSEAEPRPPTADAIPIEPNASAPKYRPKNGILEFLFAGKKAEAVANAHRLLKMDREAWAQSVAEVEAANTKRNATFEQQHAAWRQRLADFTQARFDQHSAIDARAKAAAEGEEDAISELLDRTVDALNFPEFVNANHDLDYDANNDTCVIDFYFPSPTELPTLKEVKYVQSKDEFTEKHISEAERSRLYDAVLYQIALSVIGASFKAEPHGHLRRMTLNGWVDYVDRATGMDERSCILTVSANRDDLDRIDLTRVDPKECFRQLKGVAASKLIGLAPVPPLQRPRVVDSRFIESHDVAANIDAGMNLAAMDWQEFEHLVRQLFAHLYSTPGSEVHVTQASRDGGVDAIVFDPDPIKGGKNVVQAKRYTNTVGVSAVRDLFGTVHNEGATKGILVTTSNFGPDAMKFAADKPLTLLSGSNLLALLEDMGVKARIDLREAKLLQASSSV